MTVEELIIQDSRNPRQGWEVWFSEMKKHSDDQLLDEASPTTQWDEEEWTW